MKKSIKILFAFLAAFLLSSGVMAETKPFNASITPDLSVHGSKVIIEGVTLSIWGENEQTSLALGIVNGTVGHSAGLDWSFILNYADSYKGVQWSLINYTKKDVLGWDAGFVNFTEGVMTGLASGVVNYADSLKGLEFGLINYADDASGVQIGIINIVNKNHKWFSDLPSSLAPVMIFVNWRF